MWRALDSIPMLGLCLALTLAPHVSDAQGAPQEPAKAHTSPAPRLILLPTKVVAGAPAMLAVLDSQGRLLPDVTVELSDGQKPVTDVTGRALFRGPDHPGLLTGKTSGQGITATSEVIASGHSGMPGGTGSPPGTIHVVSYPRVLVLHDRFTVEGSGFQGIADSNHIYLNGDACLIVASSPVSLVALPGPQVPVGDVTLHVTVGGMEAGQFNVSAVLLDFTGPTEGMTAGSTGKLLLHAHGTAAPLLVEIRNGSPGVIQLIKGNVQRLRTTGGEDNVAPVDVKFISGGSYEVTARLLSAEPGPDAGSSRSSTPSGANTTNAAW
jgi:hypothetical protein